MRAYVLSALLAGLFAFSSAALALESNPRMTKNEWRLLPSFCMYTQGAPGWGTDAQRRLHATNSDWNHMHHYCWAIIQTMRSYQPGMDRGTSNEYLKVAIGNLNYTINNTRPGFLMRPDMFVRKAALHARLGNYHAASTAAHELITERPDLPEGYIALADIQIKSGQPDLARETLARAEKRVDDKARLEAMKKLLQPH